MGIIKLPKESINFFKENLDKIFETGALAEGPWNANISEFCKQYCNTSYAIPTVSNGAGIFALLQAFSYLHGRKKTLIQSNTMYGVKTMANAAGLGVCGYIDCDPTTLMPGIADVERALHETAELNTLVILLSHIGGIINPDIQKIAQLCKKRNVILLEDCAHSFGSTLAGNHSGLFGDGGVYSFYATKAIPAGEGGVVVTNNDEIGKFIQKFIIYDRFDQQLEIGVNLRPSEMQALLIYSVIKETNTIIENKKLIAAKYRDACKTLRISYIEQENDTMSGNYYKFIVLAESGDIQAELSKLKTTTSKVYDYCLGRSTIITKNHACLPIWFDQPSELTDKAIQELVESKQ